MPATATPAPLGARAHAIDPRSCQKGVPLFVKVANVGNATFDGKADGLLAAARSPVSHR